MKPYYSSYNNPRDPTLHNVLYSSTHCGLKALTTLFRFLAPSIPILFLGAYEGVVHGVDVEGEDDRELTSGCC